MKKINTEKKENSEKKLNLNKETIIELTREDQDTAKGGWGGLTRHISLIC